MFTLVRVCAVRFVARALVPDFNAARVRALAQLDLAHARAHRHARAHGGAANFNAARAQALAQHSCARLARADA
eukprot:13640653-Alexandrium_andersonii.AAC.1